MNNDYRVILKGWNEAEQKWVKKTIVVRGHDYITDAIRDAWKKADKMGLYGYTRNTLSCKVIRHKSA